MMPLFENEEVERLQAEVERLREQVDTMRPHAEGCNWLRRGDAYPCSCMTALLEEQVERLKAENAALLAAFPEYGSTGNELREERARTKNAEADNERLREALALMVEEAVDDWNGPPIRPSLAPGGHAIEKARAALAGREGRPQARRKLDVPPERCGAVEVEPGLGIPGECGCLGDATGHPCPVCVGSSGALAWSVCEACGGGKGVTCDCDSRRALAERVREAAAKAIEACALNSWRVDADLVRALDLAPLLEESTEQCGGLTVRAGAPACPACRGDGCTVCLGAGVHPDDVRPDREEP